ncbi:MAG TPA: hypothetical protein VGE57_10575 [Solimonas sp.]
MMKQIAGVASLAMLSLGMAACGERAPPPTVDPPLQDSTPAVNPEPMPTPPMTPPARNEDEGVIGFHGFGPARFGDNEEAVRMAWGRPLALSGSEPEFCAYLLPDPRPPTGVAIAFMLVDGKLARYDIDSERYVAPGGGRVGSSVDQLEQLYEGRISVGPHKYVEGGKVLIATPPEGGDARLVFETNAQGVVQTWRIGVPPGVYYVEGCS